MNRAQRATLKTVLVIDAVLVLFPPFEIGAGWRAHDLGHHWLLYWLLNWGVRINFAQLAAEIVVVSVVGFTVFVLARDVADDRFAGLLARSKTLAKGVEGARPRAGRVGYTARRTTLWIAGIIGIGLAVLGIDLVVTAHDWPALAGGIFVCGAGTAACVLAYLSGGSA